MLLVPVSIAANALLSSGMDFPCTVNAKGRHYNNGYNMNQGKRTCQRNIPVRGLIGDVDVVYRTSVQTAICVTLKQIGKG